MITIGRKGSFTLVAGGHRAIKVALSGKARALLAAAGHKGLEAQLSGSGVVGRAVVLKAVGHHRRRH